MYHLISYVLLGFFILILIAENLKLRKRLKLQLYYRKCFQHIYFKYHIADILFLSRLQNKVLENKERYTNVEIQNLCDEIANELKLHENFVGDGNIKNNSLVLKKQYIITE